MEILLFFIFMLTILFIGKNLFDIMIRLFQKEPKKLEINRNTTLLIYGSLAYIFTYLLKIIENV